MAVTHFLKTSAVNHAHLAVKEQRQGNVFKANTQRNLGIEYVRRLNPHPNSKAFFAGGSRPLAVANGPARIQRLLPSHPASGGRRRQRLCLGALR
jgi:hypothetical protein